MTKADLVRAVGEERYREACRLAWQESADPRFGRKIDGNEARRILGRLRLPVEHPGLRDLAERLR